MFIYDILTIFDKYKYSYEDKNGDKMELIKKISVIIGILCCFLISCVTYRGNVKGKNGIELSEFIEIGGINQYINIRGNNIDNPIIVFIHGGPGSPMTSLILGYQTEWEDTFTIINWDQRNAGKTYTENNFSQVYSTLSFEKIFDDAWELTQYIMRRFNKEKIIIMGHSWGSIIGSALVQRHPEAFLAYISVSQVINPLESEYIGINLLLDMANNANNAKDIRTIHELLPYPSDFDSDIAKFEKIFKLRLKYGLIDGMSRSIVNLSLHSPYYSLRDNLFFLKNQIKIQLPLYEYLYSFDIRKLGNSYQIPILYIMGENDVLLYKLAKDFYDEIEAPLKKFFTIPESGHLPMLDDPESFAKILVEEIYPIILK
jgi:pimeloyl-ACP methyl ester carboxylesterase